MATTKRLISIDPAKPAGDQLPAILVDEILRLVAGSGPGGLTAAQLALVDQIRPLLDGLGGKPGAVAADVVAAWNALVAQVAAIPTGANLVNAVTAIVDNLPITANLKTLIDELARKAGATPVEAANEVFTGIRAASTTAANAAMQASTVSVALTQLLDGVAVKPGATAAEAVAAILALGGGGGGAEVLAQAILDAFGGKPNSTVADVNLYISSVDNTISSVTSSAGGALTLILEWLEAVNGGPGSAPGLLIVEAIAKWDALVASTGGGGGLFQVFLDTYLGAAGSTVADLIDALVGLSDQIGDTASLTATNNIAFVQFLQGILGGPPVVAGALVPEALAVWNALVAQVNAGGGGTVQGILDAFAGKPGATLADVLAYVSGVDDFLSATNTLAFSTSTGLQQFLTAVAGNPDPSAITIAGGGLPGLAITAWDTMQAEVAGLRAELSAFKVEVADQFQEVYDAVTGPNASIADVADRFEKLGKWLEQLFDAAGVVPDPPPRSAGRAGDDTPLPLTHIPGVVKGISMNRLKALVADGTIPHTLDGRTKLVKPSDVVAALKDADG